MSNSYLLENISDQRILLPPTQYKLLRLLKNKGPMTRSELVKELQTAPTTIYDNLVKLQKIKQIQKFTQNDGSIGRPLVYWKLTI
ncbi:MAG: helix-turn-helix domain-containing protein [Promethearchaeota archaeon]